MSEQAHGRDPHEVLVHLAQQGPREEAFRARLGAEVAEAARQIPSQAGRKSDSVRTRMRRRRGLVAALAAAAAVVIAVTLAFTLSNLGGGVSSADAAILHNVVAALTPPPGTILHEQALVSIGQQAPMRFELWVQADSPQAYRVIKWGQEVTWSGTAYSIYNADSNTIAVDPPVSRQPGHGPTDVSAALRALVQSGQATVVGSATIHGVPAYKLTVSGSPAQFLNGTAYVAKSNFHPLLIETTKDGGTIRYQTYEYLPATQANLKLLDLAAAHPGAKVINEPAQPSSSPSPASSTSK